jgi:hypothetical protein
VPHDYAAIDNKKSKNEESPNGKMPSLNVAARLLSEGARKISGWRRAAHVPGSTTQQ